MNKFNLVPIEQHSYSFIDGFTTLAGKAETRMRQIDWKKVREIINSNEYDEIEVGLAEDYDCTMATIFQEGRVDIYENPEAGFYGCSRWATPAINLYKNGKWELFECWVEGDMRRKTNVYSICKT